MMYDNSALVTVADEQCGHLPAWGNPQDISTTETHHAPVCSTGEDDSYGLDSDEQGQCVELCFAAEMSQIVLSEQRQRILDLYRVAEMRVHLTAAAERAAVVMEDDLLAKADIQANPVKAAQTTY
eukprot:1633340-Pyramimonas_sp.AAC.1